jgi:dihydroorotate dehydrogenase electron transfer subunit
MVAHVEPNGPFLRVAFRVPQIAQGLSPGCFVLADLGGYLRVPLFPACLEPEGFDVVASPDHPVATVRPGESVDIIGPAGHGFDVPAAVRRLLLVADAHHLPVLLSLALQEPGRERSVALLLSAPSASELYPIRLLPSALEVHVITADGSAGRAGSFLDLLPELVRWADRVCIACEPALHSALAGIVREVRMRPGDRFAQALVVPPIVCGVGACQGCAVQVSRGTKLACADGPVFDLLELR